MYKIKILIIGANGLLGKKAMKLFSKDHEVIGTYGSKKAEGLIPLDIRSYEKVKETIEDVSPDFILNVAAVTDVDLCDNNTKLAWDVNATGSYNIADICNKNNIKLVSMSTDYIFSGNNSPYNEDTIPHPLGFYGYSKLVGERITLEMNKNNIVIRIPILYGYNDENDKATVVTDLIDKIKQGKEITIKDARIKYPLLIDDVAQNILKLINDNCSGIFNFTSKTPVTRYEWSLMICKVFNLDSSLISEGDANPITNRPFNVQLINNKKELIFNELQEGLEIVKKQMEDS